MSMLSGIGGAGGGIQQILALRQQIIERSDLLKQIHSAPATPGVAAGGIDATPAVPGFADALKSALDGVKSVQSNAETMTTAYEKGDVTDVAKVMLARQEASVAFEATLQVRNKLLSAYQDIMRMGV